MAKVLQPLLSSSAKGRLGQTHVFYGNGLVRGWSAQIDPQTTAQLKFRAVVGAVMAMIKIADGIDRAVLRNSYSKSWHTKVTAWLTRTQLANAQALHDEWSTWSDVERANWESIIP